MKKFIIMMFMGLFFASPLPVYAENLRNNIQYFEEEAKRFNLSLILLLGIAKTESNFNPWAINIAGKSYHPKSKAEAVAIIKRENKRSYDVGYMQINSYWLRKFNIPAEIAIDPKINILLGAYILAHEINRRGGLSWQSIGAYHSPTPNKQARYFKMVKKNIYYLKNLIGEK